jgi:serine/threonine protein kinase
MDDTENNRKELQTVLKICTGNQSLRANPHVVCVFDAIRVRGNDKQAARLLIQMELCEGTLAHMLKLARLKRENWDVEVIHNTLTQILDGLRYCHFKHMIHRDLKPNNGANLD